MNIFDVGYGRVPNLCARLVPTLGQNDVLRHRVFTGSIFADFGLDHLDVLSADDVLGIDVDR